MANIDANCLTETPGSHGTMFYHQYPLSASEADEHCKNAHNARLAVLNTQDKFLDALLGIPPLPTQEQPLLCGTTYYRIGLTRANSKEDPMWITGKKFKRFNASQVIRQDEETSSGESYAEIMWGSVDILFSDPTLPVEFLCYKPNSNRIGKKQSSTVTSKSRNNTRRPSSSITMLPGTAANAGLLSAFVVITIILAVLLVILLWLVIKNRCLQKHEMSAVVANIVATEAHNYPSNDDNTYATIVECTPQGSEGNDAYSVIPPQVGSDSDITTGDVYYSSVPSMATKETINFPDVYAQVHKPKEAVLYSKVKKPDKCK